MGDPGLPSGQDVAAAENSTKQILSAVFDNLKTNAGVKVDGPVRLFFPNGIELISVIVKVNVQDGIDIEVKVAGEKGVKGSSPVEGSTPIVGATMVPDPVTNTPS